MARTKNTSVRRGMIRQTPAVIRPNGIQRSRLVRNDQQRAPPPQIQVAQAQIKAKAINPGAGYKPFREVVPTRMELPGNTRAHGLGAYALPKWVQQGIINRPKTTGVQYEELKRALSNTANQYRDVIESSKAHSQHDRNKHDQLIASVPRHVPEERPPLQIARQVKSEGLELKLQHKQLLQQKREQRTPAEIRAMKLKMEMLRARRNRAFNPYMPMDNIAPRRRGANRQRQVPRVNEMRQTRQRSRRQ